MLNPRVALLFFGVLVATQHVYLMMLDVLSPLFGLDGSGVAQTFSLAVLVAVLLGGVFFCLLAWRSEGAREILSDKRSLTVVATLVAGCLTESMLLRRLLCSDGAVLWDLSKATTPPGGGLADAYQWCYVMALRESLVGWAGLADGGDTTRYLVARVVSYSVMLAGCFWVTLERPAPWQKPAPIEPPPPPEPEPVRKHYVTRLVELLDRVAPEHPPAGQTRGAATLLRDDLWRLELTRLIREELGADGLGDPAVRRVLKQRGIDVE